MNALVDVDTLRELVSERIPMPPDGGTIQVTVANVGRGDWYWFHVEHTRDGRPLSQPVNVPVQLSDTRAVDPVELAEEIVVAILAQFERQREAN
jgi:hypothetical protein